MDLRSNSRFNRPKSKTTTYDDINEEQHSFLKYTRSTSSIINNGQYLVDGADDKCESNFENPKATTAFKRITKSTKMIRTSDYSSEEGEEGMCSKNEYYRNRMLEDARKLSEESSGITAIGLYRKAKRYWDEYPKTDWTYSPFSKDRVEITPGVVAMPNMSRRHVASYNIYTQTTNSSSIMGPKTLFSRRSETNKTVAAIDMVKKYAVSPLTFISSIFYFYWNSVLIILKWVHKAAFEFSKNIYWATCRVMLMDTWVLRGRSPERKMRMLFALCIVPLALLAGWWTTSTVSEKPIFSDFLAFPFSTDSVLSDSTQGSILVEEKSNIQQKFDAQKIASSLSNSQLETVAKYISSDVRERITQDEIIHELLKTNLLEKIVDQLTKRKIPEDTEVFELREKLQQHEILIDKLSEKLNKAIMDFESYRSRRISEEEITREQKINTDYVSKILASFLNNQEFLTKQEGLKHWLQSSFITEEKLVERFSIFTDNSNIRFEKLLKSNNDFLMDRITQRLNVELNKKQENINMLQGQNTFETPLSDDKISQIVNNILKIYDADKTGLVDYAMEPMGGQIITTRCTESYSGTAVISILGLPLWYPASSPRTVITPGINPGRCWAFQSFPGLLVIKLMSPIYIEAFSLEHISKLLVPEGKIDSAPRDFEVFGLMNEEDRNGKKLGEYRYDTNGESLQFFRTEKSDLLFEYIELKITSNHGNPNYTCLYRFRVHGRIYTKS